MVKSDRKYLSSQIFNSLSLNYIILYIYIHVCMSVFIYVYGLLALFPLSS